MTTVSPPKHHASSFFHRHHSGHHTFSQDIQTQTTDTHIFQGTDAVAQNHKVALQRVLQAHEALELKHQTETSNTGQRPDSPSSTSSDPFTIDFSSSPIPDAEVRSFRYFQRLWDPSAPADREFDEAIQPTRREFEDAAVKHFFRRIAQWHESEELLQAAREQTKRSVWRRERSKSQLGELWTAEKARSARDELKEVTTREGLAQLLWTLLHDPMKPLAPGLLEECTEALKRMYGMKC